MMDGFPVLEEFFHAHGDQTKSFWSGVLSSRRIPLPTCLCGRQSMTVFLALTSNEPQGNHNYPVSAAEDFHLKLAELTPFL
jgi:hypothetical protein